jgi:hypothetical protein
MEQLRVPPEMFRFTHADRAELYVSMLNAFGEANERLETSLGLEDVRARLRSIGWLDALDDDDLAAALGQLRLWNLMTSSRTMRWTTGRPLSTSGAISNTP